MAAEVANDDTVIEIPQMGPLIDDSKDIADPVASGLQTAASTSFGGSDHDDLSIDVERVIEFSSDEDRPILNHSPFDKKEDKYCRTPLHKACKKSNYDAVAKLLDDEEVDINYTDNNGRSAFDYACKVGNERIIDLLIKKGANYFGVHKEIYHRTPLHIACLHGHHKIVGKILSLCSKEDKKKLLNAVNSKGYTPLHYACEQENIEVVKVLLKHGADPLISSQKDPFYHHLTKPGDDFRIEPYEVRRSSNMNPKEVVKSLRKDEPDVHYFLECIHKGQIYRISSKFIVGFTPLHVAAEKGFVNILKVLLNDSDGHSPIKADIDCTDTYERTPLYCACKEGHVYVEVVKLLLEYGADPIKTRSDNGYEFQLHPLNVAAKKGYVDILKVLLKKVPKRKFSKALCIACKEKQTQVIELLLENETDTDLTDHDKKKALCIACREGYIKVVELLLEHGADPLGFSFGFIRPLHIVAKKGFVEILKVLLKEVPKSNDSDGHSQIEADINCTDLEGCTPLYHACKEGHIKVVEVLLEYGADVSATDYNNKRPLAVAAKKGFMDILKLLLEKVASNDSGTHSQIDLSVDDKSTAFYYACEQGHTEVIEMLLELGANPNIRVKKSDARGHDFNEFSTSTSLLIACEKGYEQIVELLLKRGADTTLIDHTYYKRTPLRIACEEGHEQIVKLLLDHKADVNHTEKTFEHTALQIACEEGHAQIVELLLERGADINLTNEFEHTALHMVCSKGDAQIVKLLLEHGGADVNGTDTSKHTALHHACKGLMPYLWKVWRGPRNVLQVIELLLKHGADINFTDTYERTALHMACEEGHEQVVELLLQHEAKINLTDTYKHTPLHIACKKGHKQVVKLLLKYEADVTKRDEDGLNPLDIAVEKGNKDIAMVIVNSNKWKDALRSYTEMNTGDDVDSSGDTDSVGDVGKHNRLLCCNRKRKSKEPEAKFITPMRRIIMKMPDVAKVVFDRCCKKDKPPDHPEHEITFNFEFLDDFDVDYSFMDLNERSHIWSLPNWPPPSKYTSQNHCLNILAKSPSKDLLKHQLATTLLDIKWNKIGRKFYYTNLVIYFLFVILLTSFALTVHPPNSSICMEVFGNDTDTFIDCSEKSVISQRYASFASVCLIVYSAIMILREAFQLIQFRLQYLKSFVNFIEVSLLIFTIMFASVRSNQCYCTHSWQWQVGVIAVFLSWIALIISIQKLPVVGIYVVMFAKIFNNFIKVVILALLLISAFAVPFYMMFYDPQDRAEGIRTPFITPWRTIIKTVIMTEGEYDMDSILRQNNQMNAPDIQYPVVAFSLIIVFVILMPILFLNLLTGLAVGDTEEIRKSADTHRLTLKVEFTLPIEEFLRSFAQSIFKVVEPRRHHRCHCQPGFANKVRKKVASLFFSLKKSLTISEIKEKPNKQNFLKRKIDEIEKSVTNDQATVDDVKKQIEPLFEEMKELHSSISREVRSSVSQEVKDLRSSATSVSQEVKGLRSSVSQEVKDLRSSVSQEVKDLRSSVSQEVKDLRSSMDQLLNIVNSMRKEIQGGTRGGAPAAAPEGEVKGLEEQQK